MVMKILKLDSEEEVVVTLRNGIHILGRGDLLKCQDKRISRKHAVLNVGEVQAELSSTHVNPCFYKKGVNSLTTILTESNKIILTEGDKFGFLPDAFWFRVKFIKDQSGDKDNQGLNILESREIPTPVGTQILNESNNNLKRPHEDAVTDESAGNAKKLRSDERKEIKREPNEEDLDPPVIDEVDFENNDQADAGETNPQAPTTDNLTTNPSSNPGDGVTDEIKEESRVKDDEGSPGTSGTSTNDNKNKKQIRERCWYGATCYRKNPVHRLDYSHPGDNDFLSDPEDDRPECGFGAQCYRRNKIHRREYKHPPGGQKPSKGARRKAQKKVQTSQTSDYSLDEDDIEEDPYADEDDESDDYVAESDYSSDDSHEDAKRKTAKKAEEGESQNTESEDLNLLLEEAKKFTKD